MSSNRKHMCREPGCSKVFKRREHLSRHRLNHKPKRIHTCEECQKNFVRLDLFQQHRQRHERGSQLLASDNRVSEVEGIITSEENGALSNLPDLLSPEEPYHIFFDPFSSIQDASADLNWLFDASPVSTAAASRWLSFGGPADGSFVSQNTPVVDPTAASNIEYIPSSWITARSRILKSLHGLPVDIVENPFFDPMNLKAFVDTYFANYCTHFPIIHRPTLSLETVEPLLLLSIITLGAAGSRHEEHYHIAERIHDHLRWLIFSNQSFQPPAPLWLLQALLLVQAYEKMLSSRKQHEMSHVFHAAIITLMRRGASYTIEKTEDRARESTEEREWYLWVDRESSKRVAYFAFIMDAQHASIFGHVPALSVSDLRLPLPYVEEPWESSTASNWKRAVSQHDEPPHFLPTLRSLLSRQPIPVNSSPYARFVLLHGLFSVMKHMQGRNTTALDVAAESSADLDADVPSAESPDESWKQTLHRALDRWSFSLLSQEPSLCLESGRPLYRIAHVVIHVSLANFHTLVGAPSLVSNSVRKDEYEMARRRLRKWAKTTSAQRCLNHCVLLIQETMFSRNRYRASNDKSALRPWCLYHATLILWTYGVLTEGVSAVQNIGAEEYLIQMLNGLMEAPSALKNTNQISGLLVAVRKTLENCRWQLLQEAYEVLSRLIDMAQPAREAYALDT